MMGKPKRKQTKRKTILKSQVNQELSWDINEDAPSGVSKTAMALIKNRESRAFKIVAEAPLFS